MHHNDESRTVDGWAHNFWAEYEAWTQDPSKKAPGLWSSIMKSARGYV
jgi:hypothetical protein